jgi:hypothetical protein
VFQVFHKSDTGTGVAVAVVGPIAVVIHDDPLPERITPLVHLHPTVFVGKRRVIREHLRTDRALIEVGAQSIEMAGLVWMDVIGEPSESVRIFADRVDVILLAADVALALAGRSKRTSCGS